MLLNILAVGDVVGEGGQDILARRLWELRRQEGNPACWTGGASP